MALVYREFFKSNVFEKVAVGTSNWDYYTMQFEDKTPCMVSLAKDNSGCVDSQFGDLTYFFRLYLKEPHNYELTSYGESLLAAFQNKKAVLV